MVAPQSWLPWCSTQEPDRCRSTLSAGNYRFPRRVLGGYIVNPLRSFAGFFWIALVAGRGPFRGDVEQPVFPTGQPNGNAVRHVERSLALVFQPVC